MPGLEKHTRFLRFFYFSIYSLVFVSIEKINQTLETVFHPISKYSQTPLTATSVQRSRLFISTVADPYTSLLLKPPYNSHLSTMAS